MNKWFLFFCLFYISFYCGCTMDTSFKHDKKENTVTYEVDIDSDIVDVDVDISVPLDKISD